MDFVRVRHHTLVSAATMLVVSISLSGCQAARPVAGTGTLTVEGTASVRGNEPFTRIILTTDERNTYVLSFETESLRSELQRSVPARLVVRGTLYSDSWQGERWAHLEVTSWEEAGL